MRVWTAELVRERDEARRLFEEQNRAHAHALEELEKAIRGEYENKLGIRATRAYFRFRDRFRRG